MIQSVHDNLFVGLMMTLMPPDEAPLYLDKKNVYGNDIPQLKEKLEEILKNNPDGKKLSYEEIISKITEIIANNDDSMLYYYIDCINKINDHFKYPQDKYSALYHSADVHYYDMSSGQKDEEGKPVREIFYFLTDRHR
jgi:hypothetical protein